MATSLGNTGLVHDASILANIFVYVFLSDKGLYEEGIYGSFLSFGITVIVASCIDFGSFLDFSMHCSATFVVTLIFNTDRPHMVVTLSDGLSSY